MTDAPEFRTFPKIPRLRRNWIVTEKIDGTNAIIHISDELVVRAGSRNRWITPESDNAGFAKWVYNHADELRALGPGYHYGEWWGSGIQRGYGLTGGDKRFSLFNVTRWSDADARPACCGVVPLLANGEDVGATVEAALLYLRLCGSVAQPGYTRPEGIVAYHEPSGHLFKVTLEGDGAPKGKRC